MARRQPKEAVFKKPVSEISIPVAIRKHNTAKPKANAAKEIVTSMSNLIRPWGQENGVLQIGTKTLRTEKVVDGFKCIVEVEEATSYACDPAKVADLLGGAARCMALGVFTVDNTKARDLIAAKMLDMATSSGQVVNVKDPLELVGRAFKTYRMKHCEAVRVRRKEQAQIEETTEV